MTVGAPKARSHSWNSPPPDRGTLRGTTPSYHVGAAPTRDGSDAAGMREWLIAVPSASQQRLCQPPSVTGSAAQFGAASQRTPRERGGAQCVFWDGRCFPQRIAGWRSWRPPVVQMPSRRRGKDLAGWSVRSAASRYGAGSSVATRLLSGEAAKCPPARAAAIRAPIGMALVVKLRM